MTTNSLLRLPPKQPTHRCGWETAFVLVVREALNTRHEVQECKGYGNGTRKSQGSRAAALDDAGWAKGSKARHMSPVAFGTFIVPQPNRVDVMCCEFSFCCYSTIGRWLRGIKLRQTNSKSHIAVDLNAPQAEGYDFLGGKYISSILSLIFV